MAEREKTLRERAWTVEEVDDLDSRLDRLRATYDMYFRGIERAEPLTLRKQVYRLVLQANPALINNTGLRFRLRNLVQRFNIYQNHWNRVLIQIERGTYRPAIERAKRRGAGGAASDGGGSPHLRRRRERMRKQRGEDAPAEPGQTAAVAGEQPAPPASRAEAAPASGAEATPAPERAAQQAARARAAQAPAARAGEGAGAGAGGYKSVYEELIRQRQSRQQSVAGMSYELIAKRLEASRQSIMARSGCRDVRFAVTVEDGKVKLKAVPQK